LAVSEAPKTKQKKPLSRREAAKKYAQQGYEVFPIPLGTKQSHKKAKFSNGREWGKTTDPKEVDRDFVHWPDANIGIACGPTSGPGFWVLETDTLKGHDIDGIASLKALTDEHGELPETLQVISPTGSIHYWFLWPDEGTVENSTSRVGPGIDVRGLGGMVLVPPSIRKFPDGTTGEYKPHHRAAIAGAPAWLLECVKSKEKVEYTGAPFKPQENLDLVADALRAIPNEKRDWDFWNMVGMASYRATSGHDDIFKEFCEWSKKLFPDSGAACRERWFDAYPDCPPDTIGGPFLFALAEKAKPGWRAEWNRTHGDQRPVIEIKPNEITEIAELAEQTLIGAGIDLYQRGRRLVYPIIETVDASHGRKTKVAQLEQMDQTYLTELLSRHAQWVKWDKREKKLLTVNPPPSIAASVLARKKDWSFATISGVITTPTMRPDGSIFSEPGYDPETRLLLVEPPPMPTISEAPTRDDALAALSLILDLLKEFPFVDEVSQSVGLSAIITPVARGAFPVAPMHVASATVQGSGKSYLFDIVASVAIGQLMPVKAAGRNEEETEKRLGAALIAGQPLVSIDNVNGELGGDFICQAVERPTVDVRVLGRSELVRVEARGMSMFATGNNIVITGDLGRRTITTKLDPRVERPELREFGFDPVAKILEDRGKYIAACLTICRAYQVAGRPEPAKRLASFEGWSDVVRSALIWLGADDPCISMEATRAEDPELIEIRNMLTTWADTLGVGDAYRHTLADIIEIIGEEDQNGKFRWLNFHNVIQTASKKRGGPADAASLGQWARLHKGRIVDGLWLVNDPDPKGKKGGAKWWVQDSYLYPTLGARAERLALMEDAHWQRNQERRAKGQQPDQSPVDEEIPF
jgi:hypothetical protein